MMVLRRGARPVVRLCRHEEPHPDAAAGRPLDPPDHPAVGDIWIDDVEGLRRLVEQAGDRLRDRPVSARRVVEDGRGDRARATVEPGKQGRQARGVDGSPEPAERPEEDELELRDHRALDADEEIVEAAVGEVVLDPGTPDPADAPVHQHDLAVVDVTHPTEIPAGRAPRSERPDGGPRLRRAHDAHLDAGSDEPLVEAARTTLGIGALTVDDEPHGHALLRLRDQHVREAVSDLSRPEAELVHVDGRRSRPDVGEHRRVERASLDEDLGRGRGALREAHREVAQGHGPGEQALGVPDEPIVGNE